ncbi:hypothetical protein GCM10027160_22180 [Streptomyces calidiresistens]
MIVTGEAADRGVVAALGVGAQGGLPGLGVRNGKGTGTPVGAPATMMPDAGPAGTGARVRTPAPGRPDAR